jgi:hypothetical protein
VNELVTQVDTTDLSIEEVHRNSLTSLAQLPG